MVFLRRNKKIKDAAYLLFTKIVEQARQPEFYSDWKVADTLDGRFDMIILHVALVVDRLEVNDDNKDMALLIRHVQEVLFDNMDMSLREIGVGDMSVGKKVKIMAEAYYGRAAAYAKAVRSDSVAESLKPVLIRNIYREQAPEDANIKSFVTYVIRQVACLAQQADADLMAANVIFEEVK